MKILSKHAVVYLFFAKRKGRTKRNGYDFVAKRGGKGDGDGLATRKNKRFSLRKEKVEPKETGMILS